MSGCIVPENNHCQAEQSCVSHSLFSVVGIFSLSLVSDFSLSGQIYFLDFYFYMYSVLPAYVMYIIHLA